MIRLPRSRAAVARGLLPACLLAAAVGVVAVAPPDRAATAQPPAGSPTELQYVPADAAMFVHADVAKIWASPIGKAVREADPKLIGELTGKGKELFGLTPEQVRSVTVFWPKMKGPGDQEAFGLVVAFNAAYDRAKLTAGLEKLLPKGTRPRLHTPSDRVAVMLFELGDEYAKPRPADQAGPLAATLRAAAAGKHVLVAGSALASLPDEIRGDSVPEDVRPFKSLLQSESIAWAVSLDRELTAEVRVKSASPPRAAEAEKALGLLATMLEEQLGKALKEVDGPEHTLAVLKAAQAALKGAKFSTTGEETRAVVTLPADLPYGKAYVEALGKVRGAAARAQATNNLKQIGLALHNYHDVNGAFPPAAVVDRTGKPMLSWRVLILPYIEQDQLYKQFKLDEPWDSPNNIKLLDKMPKVYADPAPTKAKANETHYQAFVGNGAAWETLQGGKLQEFLDGTSNTVVVVTAADAVPWSKPDDLAFDPDKDMRKLLGFHHDGTSPTAFGDGSVRVLHKNIDPKTLKALITRGGGEVIPNDF